MNIVMLLSKSFRTDPRVYHEAASLQAAGHSVRVIEWARHERGAPSEETVHGIRVERVHNTGLMAIVPTDHLRNPLWWRRAAKRVSTAHRERAVDVVHCHDLDTLPAGRKLAAQIGCKLVFDAHELFADILVGNQPNLIVRAARRLEARLLPHADAVIVPAPHLVTHYEAVHTAPVALVRNCFGDPPELYEPPHDGPFTITYIGILSADRMFPSLVDAVAEVPEVRFIIGGKREGLWKVVRERAAQHERVRFLGPVPFDRVLSTTRAGHAVVCMLDPSNPQYKVTPATKLYDAMACGRPIVTTAGTAMGDFVKAHGVGLAVAFDAGSVQEAIVQLRDDGAACRRMGEAGLALARQEYHWAPQAARLLAAYEQLEGRGS